MEWAQEITRLVGLKGSSVTDSCNYLISVAKSPWNKSRSSDHGWALPSITLWQPQPCLGQVQQFPVGHESSLHLLQVHRGSCGATCPCLSEMLVTEMCFEISRCIITFSYSLGLCIIGGIADEKPEYAVVCQIIMFHLLPLWFWSNVSYVSWTIFLYNNKVA